MRRRRVAVGQVDDRIDIRRLAFESALERPARARATGRRRAGSAWRSDALPVPPPTIRCWRRHQSAPPALLLRGRHVVGQREGGRALLVGVGEDADVVELDVVARSRRDRRTSSGVSPGKPTMNVVRRVTPGTRSRIRVEQPLVRASRSPGRRIRFRTHRGAVLERQVDVAADLARRSAIASSTSSVMVVG